jgi:hypothetical protein
VAIVEAYVEGLNEVLRAVRKLPKEGNNELRAASKDIANKYMAPAWRDAARNAGPWGEKLAESVKVRRDRIPAVQIGGNRRVFSGGATATMVRYPSDSGQKRESWAPFEKTDWISLSRGYQQPALQEWANAVDRIVRKWDTF